jgi:hypothetical protein
MLRIIGKFTWKPASVGLTLTKSFRVFLFDRVQNNLPPKFTPPSEVKVQCEYFSLFAGKY